MDNRESKADKAEKMLHVHIDGRAHEVREGKNFLEVCLSLGLNLPYFCWHPALGSIGACRQCAVKQYKDEKDTRGRIVMSCMTPVTENARISIEDAEARAFRASVIEWLMVNHPHDCPVCDEGSECHLQDMTLMTGHTYREYRFSKRTYRNQYLGPFLTHEMNRCIQCYRCVRFYNDYAGGRDLHAFASSNRVYFGRYEDGTLESEFSGNLAEVCPTGVFTDKTLASHYTRKWDLQTAPSICVHCGLGCNTIPAERYGTLRRIRNRYNRDVNGYFLCDRGRYGYEFVNSDRRLRRPFIRSDSGKGPTGAVGAAIERGREEVIRRTAEILAEAKRNDRLIGIGSPRASIESNFALLRLVGSSGFHSGMSDTETRLVSSALRILQNGPVRAASIREAEESDAVLILGEDVTQVAPRLALALRQAVLRGPKAGLGQAKVPEWQDASVRDLLQDRKGPLFVAAPYGTKLDEVATEVYRAAPVDLSRLGFEIAARLDERSPRVIGLSAEVRRLASRIAEQLRSAKRALIVAGWSLHSPPLLEAAANVAWALHRSGVDARICLTASESNSMGLGLLNQVGAGDLSDAFRAVQLGRADTVIILENDLYRRAERDRVDDFLKTARHVILLDHYATRAIQLAEVLLPSASFAESDGTFVNHEGRAQRFYRVMIGKDDIQPSWKWLTELRLAPELEPVSPKCPERPEHDDDLLEELSRSIPSFRGIERAGVSADFRMAGQKIPRQPHRYSGRTAMYADRTVHEPMAPEDPDSPFSFSMEGYYREGPGLQPPAAILPRFWAPGWNSVQSLNKFQDEVGGELRGGPTGVRLLGPVETDHGQYFTRVPEAFGARVASRRALGVIPLYRIFGSEELSSLSAPIQQRIPEPALEIHPADADQLGLSEGEWIELRPLKGGSVTKRTPLRIQLKCNETLARGIGALRVLTRVSELDGLDQVLPGWFELRGAELKRAAGAEP